MVHYITTHAIQSHSSIDNKPCPILRAEKAFKTIME